MKQPKYDYKQIVSSMYNDILVKHDISKLPEYFCADVIVNINGKQFDSCESACKIDPCSASNFDPPLSQILYLKFGYFRFLNL